ncbi:MAG TPA: hypothetical protein VJ764_03850, partial [Steroidobacteraceae bacterium]|nr:hypothetical protein [Steroidobacteraceae bacterium]
RGSDSCSGADAAGTTSCCGKEKAAPQGARESTSRRALAQGRPAKAARPPQFRRAFDALTPRGPRKNYSRRTSGSAIACHHAVIMSRAANYTVLRGIEFTQVEE